jgi:hypothetical protein
MNRSLLAASIVLATTAGANAAVIDFEGTTTGANRQLDVATANAFGPSLIDYAGFDWVGMFVAKPNVSINRPQQIIGIEIDPEDGPTPITQPVDAGFHRSIVSGDTIAFTQSFTGATSLFASIKARPNDDNFNFNSVYLTAGWRDNIDVNVTGLRDGVTVYTRNYVVGDDSPTLFDLNFFNIDEIRFLTSGGTFLYPNGSAVGQFVNPSNAFSTPTLAFDDMKITPVPEPATIGLLAVGLLAACAVRRRRETGAPIV